MTELDANELAPYLKRSDWRGAWVVCCQWGVTLGLFVALALWPHPVTIVIGTVLLGGRQLGFFVLTHESGHRSMFRSPRLNDFVSTWLTSPFNYTNGRAYMREHLVHHQAVGTEADPDLVNYNDYPISTQRLKRKLKRDTTGQTGWRNLKNIYAAIFKLNQQDTETRAALMRGLVVNIAMLGVMTILGYAWLYLLWLAALIFVYPAVIRIRQIAEHAAVPDLSSDNPLHNTRTTIAHPLVRLLLCPHQVNFHVEHHLYASVPIYRLHALHEELKRRGEFEGIPITEGYVNVLRSVTT